MDRFVYPRSIRRRWRVFGRFGNVHRHGHHRLAERETETVKPRVNIEGVFWPSRKWVRL